MALIASWLMITLTALGTGADPRAKAGRARPSAADPGEADPPRL